MIEDDRTFYRRRLDEERERATSAPTPEAASAHRLLATLYAHRLEDFADELRPIMFSGSAKTEARQKATASQKSE